MVPRLRVAPWHMHSLAVPPSCIAQLLQSFAFVEEVLFLILLLPSERHGTDVNDKHGYAPILK